MMPEKLEGKELYDYWNSIFDRRMPVTYEVERLISVLKGFYFSNCLHENNFELNHKEGLIEFWDSKRPYGNKDIPASIAFNLGWDYKRQLCFHAMPDFLANAANDVHRQVLEELKDVL